MRSTISLFLGRFAMVAMAALALHADLEHVGRGAAELGEVARRDFDIAQRFSLGRTPRSRTEAAVDPPSRGHQARVRVGEPAA